MLVTDRRRTRGRQLVPLVAEAVRGGVGIVQIRELDLPDDELRAVVQKLRDAVPPQILFVVNGRRRVARTQGMGLHLGAAEPEPEQRANYRLFGQSAHSLVEARRAVEHRASYIVLGTIYPTPSKPGHPGFGPALVTEVSRVVQPIPVYAIGGVVVSKIPELLHAGAHGVAVCGALLSANDPRRVAQAMALALKVAGND
jgi:thiamine-phosphate pyrophosphorylase